MRKKSNTTIAILFFLLMIFPMISPQKAAANAKFADGEYSVPFTVLKDTGSGQSATAEYVVSPAKVTIQNGKAHVVMTLNNSSWWQYFKVNSSDVQVLSDNGDKRVVKFPVQDIEQLVNAKIHIIVTGIPGFDYDNKYDIRFKFNSANIPLATVPEKPVTPTTPPPAPTPSTPEKVETKPAPKPTEKPVEKKQEAAPKAEVTKAEPKEADADKPDAQQTEKEEKATEPVDEEEPEQPKDAVDEEEKEIEADKEEEPEAEEPVEVADEQATEELKSESKSNSTQILIIVIIAAIIVGGAFFFISKKRSRTQK